MPGGGGGGEGEETKPPEQFIPGFRELGAGAETFGRRARLRPIFEGRGQQALRGQGRQLGGASAADTFGRFGVAGLTGDEKSAGRQIRSLTGFDSAVGQAGSIFRNNRGANQLAGINVGQQQGQAEKALQGFNSQALRGFSPDSLKSLNFQQLQSLQGNPALAQLQAVSSGKNLAVDSNPFLADALKASQRQVTDNFLQNVQPALASQFGGGFGLTGSSSINAQRRATNDLTRNLSEQATQTYANQFARERQAQDSATQFLGNLDFNRSNALAGFQSNRAQAFDQFKFNRASGIDANQLSRAGGLAQSGLGFTGAGINQASSLGGLENQRAQGLAGVGALKRQQQFQRIGALDAFGTKQRDIDERLYGAAKTAFDAPIDTPIRQLAGVGSILGTNPGSSTTQTGGSNRGATALGGALSGAAIGGSVGGVPGAVIGGVGGGILGLF